MGPIRENVKKKKRLLECKFEHKFKIKQRRKILQGNNIPSYLFSKSVKDFEATFLFVSLHRKSPYKIEMQPWAYISVYYQFTYSANSIEILSIRVIRTRLCPLETLPIKCFNIVGFWFLLRIQLRSHCRLCKTILTKMNCLCKDLKLERRYPRF